MTSHSRDSDDRPTGESKSSTWTPFVRAGERRLPLDSTAPPPRGKPRVLSISWIPIVVADRSVPSCSWDFYIGQTVLREIQKRFIAKGDQALGLLLGKVHDTGSGGAAPYLVIDQFLPALESIPENAEVDQAVRVLRPLQEAASLAGKTVAGWYRGHAGLGLALSDVEVRFHGHRFPASWQFALIGMANEERPRGGLFARNGAGDLVPATFHELLEPDSILGGGRKRTVLQWNNYGTTDRVVAADGREIPRPRETLFAHPGEGPAETREPEAPLEPEAPPEPAGPGTSPAAAEPGRSPRAAEPPPEPAGVAPWHRIRTAPEPPGQASDAPAAPEGDATRPSPVDPSPSTVRPEPPAASVEEPPAASAGAPSVADAEDVASGPSEEIVAAPETEEAPSPVAEEEVEARWAAAIEEPRSAAAIEEPRLAAAIEEPRWIQEDFEGAGPELVPLVLPDSDEEPFSLLSRFPFLAELSELPRRSGLVSIAIVTALVLLFALAWCG